MIDPLSVVFLVVIALSVPAIGYLVPQDPTVARLISAIHQRHQHRRLRCWVERQRQDQQ